MSFPRCAAVRHWGVKIRGIKGSQTRVGKAAVESVLHAPFTRGDPKPGPQPYGHLPSRPDALTYYRLKTCGPAEPPGFNGVLAPYAERGGPVPAPSALSVPTSEDNGDNI